MNSDWPRKRLGDVADVIAGQSPEGSSYNAVGQGLPFYQGKKEFRERFIGPPTTWTTQTTKLAKSGDILMSVRAPVGPINFATEECCIGRGLAALRTRNGLNKDFLFYFLLSRQEQISGREGAVFPSISKTEIEQIQIVHPPQAEQQRIVAVLDKAFAASATAKANTGKNLQNARALFDSRLDQTFSATKGWDHKTVAELVGDGLIAKPFDGNHGEIHPKKSDYVESGVPFVMASDLRNGTVDTENCTFIPRRLAESLRVGFARDGDVLLSHKGTIGRSAILRTKLDYVMLTPQLTSYRVLNPEKLSNKFVRYLFMTSSFQRELTDAAKDGSTRAYAGITKQLGLHMKFPALPEQINLVKQLDGLTVRIAEVETSYQQRLRAIDALKAALLDAAFSGAL